MTDDMKPATPDVDAAFHAATEAVTKLVALGGHWEPDQLAYAAVKAALVALGITSTDNPAFLKRYGGGAPAAAKLQPITPTPTGERSMPDHDAIQAQADADADVALSIAKKVWDARDPTPDAFNATFATALIHIQSMRLDAKHA